MFSMIQQHPYVVAGVLFYFLLCAVVSKLPPKWKDIPAVGVLVRLLGIISSLTHSMADGTLKFPGVPDKVLNAAKIAVQVEAVVKKDGK